MIVSRETEQRFALYQTLLRKWNATINLVAPSTLPDLRTRHIADCLQVAGLITNPTGKWVDIGSGGGLPGLVLAIAWAEADLQFVLVESDSRKCAFLRSAIRELSLTKVTVQAQRIEHLEPQNADYLSARALASLERLLPYIQRHLAPGGQAWLLKGRSWQDEADEAAKHWRFSYEAFTSETDPEAAILNVRDIANA
ncbi:16S rRNA (guanine(527)-N(7))-methyltransferase RsmG [Paracoccus sp. NSM]|uniref:16S rRNA (guanine(527)-N(7))-methyltransferase RsmG n=1 Tax=Paracoccus sp. NSM TaxID=3457784 RepID=UPI004035F73E